MTVTLTPEDEAAIAAWSPPPLPLARRWVRRIRWGAHVAAETFVGVVGGGGGSGVDAPRDDHAATLRRQVRRIREGRAATTVLWHAEDDAVPPIGPSVAQVRGDHSCRLSPPGYTLDLRDATLVGIESYSGPSDPARPVPADVRVARLHTPLGPVSLLGEFHDLAVLGVLLRWPSPGRQHQTAA